MDFYTHYRRPERILEKGGGVSAVERAGYISAKSRIENIMAAGERLASYRKATYDFEDGEIDENFIDKTREKGYDLADAFQDQERLNEKSERFVSEVEKVKATKQKLDQGPVKDPGENKEDT